MSTENTAAVEEEQNGAAAAQTTMLADIDEPFLDGFNWNTIAAMVFIGVVMMPGAILLGLVAGQNMGGAAEWVTIILFLEIAKRSFVKLKRQELIVIYWAAAMLVAGGTGNLALVGGQFGSMVWNQYLIQSPQAEAIASQIPSWVVPAKGSEALIARTFVHADWIKPIVVGLLGWFLFSINSLSLGYVVFRITSDVEQLPFPMAPDAAEGATALAETSSGTEGWRWRLFSIGTVIGLIWGTLYIVIPTLSATFLTQTVTILPIPWIDFTPNLRSVLPTALLAVTTDISLVLAGFVLPYYTVIGMFVGGMIKNFLMNPVFYEYGLFERWEPGMSLIPTTISLDFDFWLSAKIGIGIAVFAISIGMVVWKYLTGRRELTETAINSLDPEKVGPGSGRGDVPIWMALGAWVLGTGGIIVMLRILVPEFPSWIVAMFGFVYSPMLSYLSAKMTGVTGTMAGLNFPFLREGAIYMSGYEGVAIWFAPMPMADYGGWSTQFRVLQLTRTKFVSYVKLVFLNFFIMMTFSFIFWSLIWKMTQIPSSAYPYVQKMWPYSATMQTLWASSTLPGGGSLMRGIVSVPKILSGTGLAAVTFGAFMLFKAPISMFYGMMGGFTSFPTGTYLMFAGAMLNKFYFFKKFGTETWKHYAPVLLAGYGCGMGLIAMTAIAVSLVMKSISSVVF